MDESFELRVKRLFGSQLFETVPKSSFPASSWSVADGEVERREWNRERGADASDREDTPCASAFAEGGCFARRPRGGGRDRRKEFEDDLDEIDDVEGGRGGGEGEEDGEEREIRNSIGLDPTLDHEEEEDEFDRAALCRENAGERLYMRDIKDHGRYLNMHSVVPDLFEDSSEIHDFQRDPRADHFAASVRLKEDKNAVEDFLPIPVHRDKESSVDFQIKTAEDDINLKPILKRKESQIDSKPKKRVRFDPGCKEDNADVNKEHQSFSTVPLSMETTSLTEAESSSPEVPSRVPDYVRNPSKYTRYTFDESDKVDDETNKRAFEDFRNSLMKSNPEQMQPESPIEHPKSVTFIPRKKSVDAMSVDDNSGNIQEETCKEDGQMSSCSTGIAAGESHESDACDMEEDDVETSVVETAVSMRKGGRRYRPRSSSDDST